MRLWTLHPKHLDRQGLLALWREGLLAQAVLAGKTKGYRNHPQLARFKRAGDPVAAIGAYLKVVHAEASERGYSFDSCRIAKTDGRTRIRTTRGQMEYERKHLLKKLKARDPERFRMLSGIVRLSPNPVFAIVPGGVEPWERAK
jgi:hypothetical protein